MAVRKLSRNASKFDLKPENIKGTATFTRKVGNKTYKFTVGYNQAFLDAASDPAKVDEIIRKMVDQTQDKIVKLGGSSKQKKITIHAKVNDRKATFVSPNKENRPRASTLRNIATDLSSTFRRETNPEKPLPKYNFRQINVGNVETALKHMGEHPVQKDKYGVKNWRIGNYIIHEFDEDSYNGQKCESFLTRQHSIYEAVVDYVRNKIDVDDQTRDELLKEIQEKHEAFLKEMSKDEYKLDLTQMKNPKYATEHFRQVFEPSAHQIAKFTKEVQILIDNRLGNFSINQLAQIEKEYIHEQDRPIVVNVINYGKGPFAKKFFSMQTPESTMGKTIPSSLRDRPGLANYVKTSFGEIKEDGQIDVTYQAIRHSCYPPYAIEDPYLRQAYTLDNVKQGLTDWARRIIESDSTHQGTKEDPIIIPLRTMMLLTPKAKFVDSLRNRAFGFFGKWKGESETMQLEEGVLGLNTYHNRTIPLIVDGETVWAKIDASAMNFGANIGATKKGLIGMIPTATIQKKVNAKGFMHFMHDVIVKVPDFEKIEALETSHRLYAKVHEKYQDILRENEQPIAKAYERLEKLYGDYKNSLEDFKKLKELRRDIRKVKREIRRRERKIYSSALTLASLRRAAYKKNLKEIEIREDEIWKSLKSSNEKNAFKAICMARKIFYEKAYLQPESVMDFQVYYVLAMDLLGYLIELFCKSSEDRTGSVDDKVQALKAFITYLETFPQHDSEINSLKTDFRRVLHYYSSSQDNTELNSYARGLQVCYKVEPDFDAIIDKAAATLAKKIFSRAKKLKI